MRLFLDKILRHAIGVIMIFSFCVNARAQEVTFPSDSCNVTYSMQIEFKNAYISGICMLVKDGETIKSSVVNEFGVSLIDFIYDIKKDKIKLKYVMSTLNKWYIKRVLKKDLKSVLHIMQNGGNEFDNEKHKLYYRFNLITDTEDKEIID